MYAPSGRKIVADAHQHKKICHEKERNGASLHDSERPPRNSRAKKTNRRDKHQPLVRFRISPVQDAGSHQNREHEHVTERSSQKGERAGTPKCDIAPGESQSSG